MKNILTILISIIILGVIFFGCKKDEGPAAAGPVTVSGFVKDLYGIPVVNASVVISGKLPVTTNASGNFSIPNVTTPYDISLIVSSSKLVVQYKSLTRSDPKLLYIGNSGTGTSYSTTITGTVPAATGKNTIAIFSSGDHIYSTYADQSSGSFTVYCSWYGMVDSLAGKLYILRYTTGSAGLPDVYDAYKDTSITIKSGVVSSGKNFTASNLSDPQDSNIGGTVTCNSGYSVPYRALYISFNGCMLSFGYESNPASTSFSYHVPIISGMTFDIYAYAMKSSTPSNIYFVNLKTGITAGTMNVNIALANAPQLSLPLYNATNVDTSTNFSWSQGGGDGVNMVYLSSGNSANPSYYIFTTGSNLTIPNYSSLALELPPSTLYYWQVIKFFPVTLSGSPSIDNVASDKFMKLYSSVYRGYYNYPLDQGYSFSEQFRFTTKP